VLRCAVLCCGCAVAVLCCAVAVLWLWLCAEHHILHALTRTFLFDEPRVSLHTLPAFAVLSRYTTHGQWMQDSTPSTTTTTTASASASAQSGESKAQSESQSQNQSQAQGQGQAYQRFKKMTELLKVFSGM
jgi:hypothetical protein